MSVNNFFNSRLRSNGVKNCLYNSYHRRIKYNFDVIFTIHLTEILNLKHIYIMTFSFLTFQLIKILCVNPIECYKSFTVKLKKTAVRLRYMKVLWYFKG